MTQFPKKRAHSEVLLDIGSGRELIGDFWNSGLLACTSSFPQLSTLGSVHWSVAIEVDLDSGGVISLFVRLMIGGYHREHLGKDCDL